jgi:predicted membrane protein
MIDDLDNDTSQKSELATYHGIGMVKMVYVIETTSIMNVGGRGIEIEMVSWYCIMCDIVCIVVLDYVLLVYCVVLVLLLDVVGSAVWSGRSLI